MIQRIQTLYLLLVAALMITLIWMPLATLNAPDASYRFMSYGLVTMGGAESIAVSTVSLSCLAGLSGVLAFLSVFFYKQRPLQIRCCQLNFLLILAFYLVFFVCWWSIQRDLDAQNISLGAALTLPLAAIVLDYIAMKKIKQDDDLVKSMDRIR
ncbi:MAG: DUF4293 domain-containing protein [Coprobacter sp.]|nr:DUF4293 domain-containing protein [Coprobacter sp.]